MSLIKYLKKVTLAGFSYLPSEIKIFTYRCMGAKIGKNVELGLGSFIIPSDYDFKNIEIEDGVTIEDGVSIFTKKLFLGNAAQIKNNTKISGQSEFTAGKSVYIDQECHFDLRKNISLGNDVIISGGCWFYTHMVFHSVLEGAPSKLGQITVEERTYLGANAFVLPGITIGHDAIIGARAVITKNVNADTVMVGNPAKEIGKTSQRTSKLLTEDKKKIVKNILLDFIDVHHEKISHIKLWDNSEMTFFYQNQTIAFIPCSDTFTVVDKKKKNPDILISFNIPEKVRAECDKNAIPWFDLDSGTKSSIMNTYSRSLERFFKNYGIVIA